MMGEGRVSDKDLGQITPEEAGRIVAAARAVESEHPMLVELLDVLEAYTIAGGHAISAEYARDSAYARKDHRATSRYANQAKRLRDRWRDWRNAIQDALT
jgi:hypothetical protein